MSTSSEGVRKLRVMAWASSETAPGQTNDAPMCCRRGADQSARGEMKKPATWSVDSTLAHSRFLTHTFSLAHSLFLSLSLSHTHTHYHKSGLAGEVSRVRSP